DYGFKQIMDNISYTPELLIEQLLLIYPELWTAEFFENLINKTTTITFVENIITIQNWPKCMLDRALSICLNEASIIHNDLLIQFLIHKKVKQFDLYSSIY